MGSVHSGSGRSRSASPERSERSRSGSPRSPGSPGTMVTTAATAGGSPRSRCVVTVITFVLNGEILYLLKVNS